jgi:DDRGK domain-containing protein 1
MLFELMCLFFWIPDRLSGVMDDRGKFIYISTEEMKAVAEYIRKEGRVSISHLANSSNQFIDLEPKAQYNEEQSEQADGATEVPEA